MDARCSRTLRKNTVGEKQASSLKSSKLNLCHHRHQLSSDAVIAVIIDTQEFERLSSLSSFFFVFFRSHNECSKRVLSFVVNTIYVVLHTTSQSPFFDKSATKYVLGNTAVEKDKRGTPNMPNIERHNIAFAASATRSRYLVDSPLIWLSQKPPQK
jgi:hypothetical protein